MDSSGVLEKIESVSRTISIVAIPLVLAVGGWIIQRQLQSQTIGATYVNLAVTILENPDKSKVPNELREWAVDLLNDNSPTKLNPKAVASLKSGDITLPSSFNFVPSTDLTPDIKQQLETSLNDFQRYMASLGFVGEARRVSVVISPGTVIETKDGGGVAIWVPKSNSMNVARAFVNDQPSVLRQLAHRFLLAPQADLGGVMYGAIESGLATYFACSFVGEPVMGGKASESGKLIFPPQDLRSQRKLSEIKLGDWVSVQNEGSAVWGGALWRIRELVGKAGADAAIALAWRDLLSQKPEDSSAYGVFGNILLKRLGLTGAGKYVGPVKSTLEQIGLTF
jgi:hypothetical protein